MRSFVKELLLMGLVMFMVFCPVFGQSTGDICIIGSNSDAPDIVLIVALVDVAGSTNIYLSDNEWNGSAWVDQNEGNKRYTTPAEGLSAGDVIELDCGNNTATVGTLISDGGSFNLSASGDQLYMYLGSSATSPTTFLFATTTFGIWDTNELTNTGLTSGTNALIFTSSTDNTRYDGTRSGTIEELQSAISNVAGNWVTSSSPYTFSTTAFTINDPPLPITLASFTATAVNGTVELAWETASETNNASFMIYRNDVVIASVEGAGTTSEPHSYSYVDADVVPGVAYTYVLADVDYANVETKYDAQAVTVTLANDLLEADFVVGAAYPNPFNPTAVVPLTLSADAMVEASVYDLLGREVKALVNGNFAAGTHELHIDGSNMTTGIYLVKVMVDNVANIQKIALMK